MTLTYQGSYHDIDQLGASINDIHQPEARIIPEPISEAPPRSLDTHSGI